MKKNTSRFQPQLNILDRISFPCHIVSASLDGLKIRYSTMFVTELNINLRFRNFASVLPN
jgi:hypothetical protein